uniref:Uncharacterized protein n=1 Tax=Ananas comosus var. bracteatus TaxID=296719 RepID=A0A6V7NIQ3_ANACO|nr:unnamed protein product [Ananas comosus var. bracteatus]
MLRACVLDFGGGLHRHLRLSDVGERKTLGPEILIEAEENVSVLVGLALHQQPSVVVVGVASAGGTGVFTVPSDIRSEIASCLHLQTASVEPSSAAAVVPDSDRGRKLRARSLSDGLQC